MSSEKNEPAQSSMMGKPNPFISFILVYGYPNSWLISITLVSGNISPDHVQNFSISFVTQLLIYKLPVVVSIVTTSFLSKS